MVPAVFSLETKKTEHNSVETIHEDYCKNSDSTTYVTEH